MRCHGGAEEIRTPDPYVANVMLYQLSYRPMNVKTAAMIPKRGRFRKADFWGARRCAGLPRTARKGILARKGVFMKQCVFKETALGRIGIEADGDALTQVWLPGCGVETENGRLTPVLRQAFRELEEYAAGRRRTFDVPLAPRGTPFQMRVWAELRKVKFGECVSYGELARRAGTPKAARAVGGAMNRNPLAIFIPCHRVIGTNGSLTGFGGGLEMKEKLLALEGVGVE